MAYLKINKMTNPTPEQIDWTTVITVIATIIGGLIGWFYFVHWYFKNKKEEKEAWIKSIATEAVNAAMNSCLQDVRADIQTLFSYRETDRVHLDRKFDSIMAELRKT